MASFRDILENCGPDGRSANPVLNMVDMFTGDKSGLQDHWQHDEFRPMPPPRHTRSPVHSGAAAATAEQQQMRSFLNPDEFHAFEAGVEDAFGRLDVRDGEFGPELSHPARMGRQGKPPQRGGLSMFFPGGGQKSRVSAFEQEKLREQALLEYASQEHKSIDEDFEEFENVYTQPGAAFRGPLMMQAPPKWAEEFEDGEFEEVHRQVTESQTMVDEFLDPEVQKNLDAAVETDTAKQLAAQNLQNLASKFEQIRASEPQFRNSEFMQFMQQLGDGSLKVGPDGQSVTADSSAGRTNTTTQEPKFDVDEFAEYERTGKMPTKDFASDMVREFENFNVGNAWAESFEKSKEGEPDELEAEYERIWQQGRDEEFRRQQSAMDAEYEFEQENPHLNDPNAFDKGVALFKQGNITEAILFFEAAVQTDPSKSIAWQYLGQAQAENDKDDQASRALVRAIRSDPENLTALMSLAVSYTNDLHKERALDCLRQWLASHPHYQGLASQIPDHLPPDFDESHFIVSNIFMSAARLRPADPDPDVQTALGLLYNLSFEYNKAIDCFRAAVSKRPDDYLLWNKLGATQANSTKNEEAVEAYFHALDIKPTYTRARSNLGISFLALRQYGEAAKAFLSALTINPNADHLWDNLRAVFSLMERPDLLDKSDHRDVKLFSDEFTF